MLLFIFIIAVKRAFSDIKPEFNAALGIVDAALLGMGVLDSFDYRKSESEMSFVSHSCRIVTVEAKPKLFENILGDIVT